MTRPRVYISGPITKGDQRENVANASRVFVALESLGFAPYCPHWSWFGQEHDNVRLSHDRWMNVDLPWVEVSEALLRMPGESTGADIEVGYAHRCGVPVFDSIEDLHLWHQQRTA